MANTSYTPGTEAQKWVNEEWAREIDRLCYNLARVYPNVSERPMPHNKLHIPLHGNLSVTKPTDSTDLVASITLQAPTENEVTMSPATAYCAVGVNRNTVVRMMTDPDDTLRTSIERALQQQTDQDEAALFLTAVVTNIEGDGTQHLDQSAIASAYGKGCISAKEYWLPGETEAVACIANNEIQRIITIQNIISAQVRGDAETPVVKGWVARAFGCRFYATGNMPTSGAVGYSGMFIPRALGIGWNQRFTITAQEFNIGYKLIGWGDYAVGAVREQYAVALKHPTT